MTITVKNIVWATDWQGKLATEIDIVTDTTDLLDSELMRWWLFDHYGDMPESFDIY